MGKKLAKRKTVGAEEPVRSGFDFCFRVREIRAKIMNAKYERAEKLVRKQLASACEAVKALRGDADWLIKIIPYLGRMCDCWMTEYLGVSLSVIRKLREKHHMPAYDKDEELERAMSRLEKGKTGLAEQFKDVDLAKIAPQFGIKFPQGAQSADAV